LVGSPGAGTPGSFGPAFWPASLRHLGSRLRAFVLKRPSGMPLTLRRSRLAPAAPSGPRAGFQSLRPFPQSSGIGLRLVPPQTAPALRPSPLAVSQLPLVCGPPGSRSLEDSCPPEIRPLACSSSRSACASRRSEPAFRSCLGVPVVVEVRLAPRFNLPGLPFRMMPLRASSLRCLPKPFSRLAPLARPFRTRLPVREPPVPGLRPALWVRPSSLPLRLPSACASGFCSGPAAGSIGYLSPRACASGS
jgi:hypothetical protein